MRKENHIFVRAVGQTLTLRRKARCCFGIRCGNWNLWEKVSSEITYSDTKNLTLILTWMTFPSHLTLWHKEIWGQLQSLFILLGILLQYYFQKALNQWINKILLVLRLYFSHNCETIIPFLGLSVSVIHFDLLVLQYWDCMLTSESIEGGFVLFKFHVKRGKWKKFKALKLKCHIQLILSASDTLYVQCQFICH